RSKLRAPKAGNHPSRNFQAVRGRGLWRPSRRPGARSYTCLWAAKAAQAAIIAKAVAAADRSWIREPQGPACATRRPVAAAADSTNPVLKEARRKQQPKAAARRAEQQAPMATGALAVAAWNRALAVVAY